MSSTKSAYQVSSAQTIQKIPIVDIRIGNPRVRSKKAFAGIVESIATIGLKRPITVAEQGQDQSKSRYDLICGQGRIEAFQALGETHIPAIVVKASEVDRYLMSLIENLARRKHSNRDLLSAVQVLSDRGYSNAQIGRKTGLEPTYIAGILVLLRGGEDRLIGAVEKGWLPLSLAKEIARSSEADVQLAMMEAYETGVLKGEQLLRVRRLIVRRKSFGQGYGAGGQKSGKTMTAAKLAQTFQEEARRQKLAIQKSELAEQRLLILATAMKQILADDHFRTLLRAEGIVDLPKPLAERVYGEKRL